MCGILFSCQPSYDLTEAIRSSDSLKPRGPDAARHLEHGGCFFAFRRLAINDVSDAGMQPFVTAKHILICNGEIYNSRELQARFSYDLKSKSDCEIISHLVDDVGIGPALSLLQGVFAFVLYDKQTHEFVVARDAVGIKSLYMNKERDVFGSELKALHPLCTSRIDMFPAGHYYESKSRRFVRHAVLDYQPDGLHVDLPIEKIHEEIRDRLSEAVRVRCVTSDRPVGCFLSGGLDSSLVAGLAARYLPGKLLTFSVGMENATDLAAARLVAEHIGSEHHELVVSEKEMLDAIPRVIRRIESYDTTTVRASTGMVLLSDWIKANFPTTVVFSGEGADELSGSYKYFDKAPSPWEMQKESSRLLGDLQYFDVLRCDKSVSGSGLEARTPFLDMNFVSFYMRLDPRLKSNDVIEKNVLRNAFKGCNVIPDAILNRKKEAFSDGCSSMEKPWFSIIQAKCDEMISDDEWKYMRDKYLHNKPTTKEGYWFRSIFEKWYEGRGSIVPYIWLPKWTGLSEPPVSARLLVT